jgi:hypothetical protein
VQKVNLPFLAALTRAEHSVKIVDETFAPDDVDEEVDLVGITVMTDLARRAYQIADTYRQHGVKVVMASIHPTVLPHEALEHADAVVIGEAEEVCPKLLSDAASGAMQKLYRGNKMSNLNRRPMPRRDLYPKPKQKGYTPIAVGIETARGCPYDCEFCSIGPVMGRQYRSRPIPEVIGLACLGDHRFHNPGWSCMHCHSCCSDFQGEGVGLPVGLAVRYPVLERHDIISGSSGSKSLSSRKYRRAKWGV